MICMVTSLFGNHLGDRQTTISYADDASTCSGSDAVADQLMSYSCKQQQEQMTSHRQLFMCFLHGVELVLMLRFLRAIVFLLGYLKGLLRIVFAETKQLTRN